MVLTSACVLLGGLPTHAAETAESAVVKQLLQGFRTTRGVCAVLGIEDGKFVRELAQQSEFTLHVWEPREAAVQTARKLLDREQLHGTRVVVERGSYQRLPYADNSIDLVVAVRLTDSDLQTLTATEVLRVL